MSTRHLTRWGLWITCGGVIVLISFQLVAGAAAAGPANLWPQGAGAAAGYALVGIGLLMLLGFRDSDPQAGPVDLPTTPQAQPLAPAPRVTEPDRLAGLLTAFEDWQATVALDPALWSAFDQFVREQVRRHLHAAHTRCFAYDAGDREVRSLTVLHPSNTPAATLPAREGIIGHVLTTGRPYFAHESGATPLLSELAQADERAWQAVYPVRVEGSVHGLIAVADGPSDTPNQAPDVLRLLSWFWSDLACRIELNLARSIDKASGVLTREDFFSAAQNALSQSNEDSEPVVAAAFSFEGLRGLDDAGQWSLRDTVVERVGRVLAKRVRRDDLLGRFSDDRFVVLLRRLDSGLGKIITRKLLDHVVAVVAGEPELAARVHVRVGLYGSGLDQSTALETLLRGAFSAVETARRTGVALYADVDSAAEC